MDAAAKSCTPGTSTITSSPSSVTISSPKQLNGMATATTVTSSSAPTKNGCERRWKSKNGERLRDPQGYRLRAAGVCARRNAVNGQLEMLLVSAQRGEAWVIPGGGIEIGEEMHEAVLREVEEEAGVRADVIELIGEFQDNDRLHRTALYLLSPLDELETWEDGLNGRLRRWLSYTDALEAVKVTQRSMLEITGQRIAEIEKTARSPR